MTEQPEKPCPSPNWHKFPDDKWHNVELAEDGGWYIDGVLFTHPKTDAQ